MLIFRLAITVNRKVCRRFSAVSYHQTVQFTLSGTIPGKPLVRKGSEIAQRTFPIA